MKTVQSDICSTLLILILNKFQFHEKIILHSIEKNNEFNQMRRI